MTNQSAVLQVSTGFDIRKAGIIAGLGYVALFILAIFANFFVKESMIVAGDAEATARNILGAPGLFRLGMASFLLVFLIDVFVAWGLHIVFRRAHHDLSLLAAWFRIVYTVFLGVALVFFFEALRFLELGGDFFELALVSIESFNSVWLIGLTAFGLHLVVLGGLILKHAVAPRVLGIILILAGTAYVADTLVHTLAADYQSIATLMITIVAIPSVISEGWFGIWLLLKAGKSTQ